VHSTAAVMSTHVQRLELDFKLLVDRNPDLLSLALRRQDGRALVATEGHADHWQEMSGEYSQDSQVRVPIWAGERKWGQLELRFKALDEGGFRGVMQNPMIRIMLFMGCLALSPFTSTWAKCCANWIHPRPSREGCGPPWTRWRADCWCSITRSKSYWRTGHLQSCSARLRMICSATGPAICPGWTPRATRSKKPTVPGFKPSIEAKPRQTACCACVIPTRDG